MSADVQGVTTEAIKLLRALAATEPASIMGDALREALGFYDLTAKAWQGCREEYTEDVDALTLERDILKGQLEATQTELERRTAWSNDELARLRSQLAATQDLLDTARQVELQLAEERICAADAEATLALQVEELKADLRRFEPSDAMMYRLLEHTTRLQEADDLLTDLRVWAAINPPELGLIQLMKRVDAWHQRHLSGVGKAVVTRWYQAIVDAADLLDEAQGTVIHAPWPEITEWLARPVVALARKGTR